MYYSIKRGKLRRMNTRMIMPTEANQKILDTLEFCRESGCLPNGSKKCSLCAQLPAVDDEPFLVGLYVPDKEDQKRMRMRTGRSRAVIYLLCWSCFERPDTYENVAERVICIAGVQ